jgi:hypothetical protein
MIHPLRESLRDRAGQFTPIPFLGALHSPDLIIGKILEVIGN